MLASDFFITFRRNCFVLVIHHLYVVDDDPDDREILTDLILKIRPDMRIEEFPDGEVLLKHLAGHPVLPDLIFLDLNMPRVDGRDCLLRLKSSPETRHVPVYIYSTSNAPRDQADTQRMGAAGFVVKTSNLRALQQTLHRLLGNNANASTDI